MTFSTAALFGFLLVLARVTGALAFVPFPGFARATATARIALCLGFTLALYPRWPAVDASRATPAALTGWLLAEAALGISIGLTAAMVLEAFTLAAQILGLQAGYGYASTIDPNTQADSGVLLVFAQLIAGMLFFALGFDREILRLFARSLEKIPAGAYVLGLPAAAEVIRLGGALFSAGLRLALPVVALLILVDVALALLGRLHAQLQLLSLAFPIKMLLTLAVWSWVALLFPRILSGLGGQAWGATRRILGI